MNRFLSLRACRQACALVLVAAGVGAAFWQFLPGLPVLWGPWASAADRAAGQMLFEHEWEPNDPLARGDGLGPVFNASSCVACHFQGGVGGAGSGAFNVSNYEVLPTVQNPKLGQGVVHTHAVDPSYQESWERVHEVHPIVKGRTEVRGTPDCSYQFVIPDFDPIRPQTVNSTALFGVGWVDRIPAKSIQANQLTRAVRTTIQEFSLDFDSIPAGRVRILPDGRVGKFGWKAQFATLREFVAAACANELGLSNPVMDQPRPVGRSDYPVTKRDLDHRQFGQLVAFVDTLPRPVEVMPADPAGQTQAERGKVVFQGIGCAACHTPDLGGVQGVYSDFLLHRVEQPNGKGEDNYQESPNPPVPLPSDHPRPDEWKTPALWGVADSAPYFHDGGSPTLKAAILRHGGDAASVTKAYQKLPALDQEALVAFLLTLKAPPEADPATAGTVVRR